MAMPAVGRFRYERFYSVRSNYARENMSSKTFARAHLRVPLKELSRLKLRRLTRLNTIQKIARSHPKFLIIPVDLMYFVMLSNASFKRITREQKKIL